MRRIRHHVVLDPDTFEPVHIIAIKEGDKTTVFKQPHHESPWDKYTAAERELISLTNTVLENKGVSKMSGEEIEYFLNPFSLPKLNVEVTEPVQLQRLAGFSVETRLVLVPEHIGVEKHIIEHKGEQNGNYRVE